MLPELGFQPMAVRLSKTLKYLGLLNMSVYMWLVIMWGKEHTGIVTRFLGQKALQRSILSCGVSDGCLQQIPGMVGKQPWTILIRFLIFCYVVAQNHRALQFVTTNYLIQMWSGPKETIDRNLHTGGWLEPWNTCMWIYGTNNPTGKTRMWDLLTRPPQILGQEVGRCLFFWHILGRSWRREPGQ